MLLYMEVKSIYNYYYSAGVGRSGTYIAIDCLIQQAAAEGLVDIVKLVHQMRLERMHMVQTAVSHNRCTPT